VIAKESIKIKIMKKVFFLFAIILFLEVSYSQEFDKTKKVKITHGENITVGYILSYDTTYCVIELEDKDHTILRILTEDIEKIEPYKKEQEEDESNTGYSNDPNDYRLFIFPTGKTLNGGKVSISLHEGILPVVSVGIFDRMTLSVLPFPFVLIVFPKINLFHSKNTDLAISGVYVGIPGELPFTGGFLVYTIRSENIAATFGGGILNSPNHFLDFQGTNSTHVNQSPPLLVLGLETRVTENIKTIFEGWIEGTSPHLTFTPAGGVRILGWNFSIDFAIGIQITSGGRKIYPIPIPLFTLSYNF
jgi:hypothetical protein